MFDPNKWLKAIEKVAGWFTNKRSPVYKAGKQGIGYIRRLLKKSFWPSDVPTNSDRGAQLGFHAYMSIFFFLCALSVAISMVLFALGLSNFNLLAVEKKILVFPAAIFLGFGFGFQARMLRTEWRISSRGWLLSSPAQKTMAGVTFAMLSGLTILFVSVTS